MPVGFRQQRIHPRRRANTPCGRRKDTREAPAIVRQHPLGRELIVMVGQDIGCSRLYRDHGDSRRIPAFATN
jgi:hypothetical protein